MNVLNESAREFYNEFQNVKVKFVLGSESFALDDGYNRTNENGEIELKRCWPFELVLNDSFILVSGGIINNKIYKDHLEKLKSNFVNSVSSFVEKSIDPIKVLNRLSDYSLLTKEYISNYKEEEYRKFDKAISWISNLNASEEYSENKYIDLEEKRRALDSFYKPQYKILKKVLVYLEEKIELIKSSESYSSKSVRKNDDNTIKQEMEIIKSKVDIVWEKSDTDLLELIAALFESKSIQNSKQKLTRKEAIKAFSDFFNIEIKDAESKLSKATDRDVKTPLRISLKKKKTVFIIKDTKFTLFHKNTFNLNSSVT